MKNIIKTKIRCIDNLSKESNMLDYLKGLQKLLALFHGEQIREILFSVKMRASKATIETFPSKDRNGDLLIGSTNYIFLRSKGEVNSLLYLADSHVTQELYSKLMGPTAKFVAFKGSNKPAYNLSYLDAIKLCNRLSEAYGLEPCYDIVMHKITASEAVSDNYLTNAYVETDVGKEIPLIFLNNSAIGFRLPTSLEMNPALEDTKSKEVLDLDGLEARGWLYTNSGKKLQAIKTRKPNNLGFYDLHGNVFQYLQDIEVFFGNIHESWMENEAKSRFSNFIKEYLERKQTHSFVASYVLGDQIYACIYGGDFISFPSELGLHNNKDFQEDGMFCPEGLDGTTNTRAWGSFYPNDKTFENHYAKVPDGIYRYACVFTNTKGNFPGLRYALSDQEIQRMKDIFDLQEWNNMDDPVRANKSSENGIYIGVRPLLVIPFKK